MFSLFLSMVAPLTSLGCLLLASGLFNTLTPIVLEQNGTSTATIGWVTSSLYAGILFGSLKLVPWIERRGLLRSFSLFALVSTLLIIVQGFWVHPLYWALLRFLGGVCTAGIFIVVESWLLIAAGPSKRAFVLSLYLSAFYGALSLGQFLLHLCDPFSFSPFLIAAACSGTSLLPLFFYRGSPPQLTQTAPLSLRSLFSLSPLGLVGGMISGMVLAAIYSFVPLFGKSYGMSPSDIGTLMGIIILGGVLFQIPFSHFSGKGGRRRFLNIVCLGTAFLGIILATVEISSLFSLFLICWVFGGFAFTIYPLSMAHLCDSVEERHIVTATGGFVFYYGVGAILGPLLSPLMSLFAQEAGVFYFIAFVTATLFLVGLKKPLQAPAKTPPSSIPLPPKEEEKQDL